MIRRQSTTSNNGSYLVLRGPGRIMQPVFEPMDASVYRPFLYRAHRPIYQDLLKLGYYDYTIYKKLLRLWEKKITLEKIPVPIIEAAIERAQVIRRRKNRTLIETNFLNMVRFLQLQRRWSNLNRSIIAI